MKCRTSIKKGGEPNQIEDHCDDSKYTQSITSFGVKEKEVKVGQSLEDWMKEWNLEWVDSHPKNKWEQLPNVCQELFTSKLKRKIRQW